MNVKTRVEGKICILDVNGELKHGETHKLRDASKEAIDAGHRTFVLDLLGSRWIDSSGVGEVIALRHRVQELQGRLVVAMKDKVHGIFVVHELNKILHVYQTLKEALDNAETADVV